MLAEHMEELELMGSAHFKSRRIVGHYKTLMYRLKAKRWRILFTEEENCLHVWIVDIEKDTKKDYDRWIAYIKSQH